MATAKKLFPCDWERQLVSLKLVGSGIPQFCVVDVKTVFTMSRVHQAHLKKKFFREKKTKTLPLAPLGVDNSLRSDSRQISQTGRKMLGDYAEFSNPFTLNLLKQKILS